MEQQIHFCVTDDDVRIAYATVGEGPPLVKAANWLSHLEFDWRSSVWRHLLAEFARDIRSSAMTSAAMACLIGTLRICRSKRGSKTSIQ